MNFQTHGILLYYLDKVAFPWTVPGFYSQLSTLWAEANGLKLLNLIIDYGKAV